MNKTLFLFVGPSGSGKTTIVSRLEKLGYKSVSSYTDRSPRSEDESGHIFVSEKEFNELGELIACTIYNGSRYGVPENMVLASDIYVIEMDGVDDIKKRFGAVMKIVVIGLTAEESLLADRMRKRGDADEDVRCRMETDLAVFSRLDLAADYIVNTGSLVLEDAAAVCAGIMAAETEEENGWYRLRELCPEDDSPVLIQRTDKTVLRAQYLCDERGDIWVDAFFGHEIPYDSIARWTELH